jgi:diadenosine tetraphosphate (Ap4A) HIT family hydrolase
MAKKKKFVDVAGAGDRAAYAEVLKKIQKDGVCPFCPKYFKYHTKPILAEGKHWLVTENFAPYGGTRLHFLFLHKKHVEHVDKVSPAAWQELLTHIKKITRKYKIPGGSFFMRFGNEQYTGASVTHLHAQMIVGSKRDKNSLPIAPTLGFRKK